MALILARGMQETQCTYARNIEACSREHCCRRKTI